MPCRKELANINISGDWALRILRDLCTPSPPLQWAEHANLLWDLHEQELSKVNDFCREKNKQHGRSQTLLKKKLAEERERGCLATVQERDAAAAQLRAAQEASFVLTNRGSWSGR